jgi:hypothetical protein
VSVLVEALSLVIRHSVLDISYPGGTHAFVQRMRDPSVPCRCVCSDDTLVSVSFFGADDATVVGSELLALGIVAMDDDRFYELAFIDQAKGPTMPCDWIEWQKHEAGYTSCWLAGTEPEPLHAPDNWTPEQSRRLTFHDVRSEPGRCMKLADEPDGHEVWLDFETGKIAPGDPLDPVTESEIEQPTSSAPEGMLLSTIRAMLDAQQFQYQAIGTNSLTSTFHNEHGVYTILFSAWDATAIVTLWGAYGSNIPENRRVPIAEALTRINFLLSLGNFELDFSDGELHFRIGIDVEDGRLSEKMLSNMLCCTLHAMERFHVALMRIAFGDIEPETALAEYT